MNKNAELLLSLQPELQIVSIDQFFDGNDDGDQLAAILTIIQDWIVSKRSCLA